MKITLYRQCILNNSYSEVFDMKSRVGEGAEEKSALEDYLSTLPKMEFDVEYAYMAESGSIYLDAMYNLTVYSTSFNYMKVEQQYGTGSDKRYYFIDSIEYVSETGIKVYYSIDVWSSYSGTMVVRDGVICNKLRFPRGYASGYPKYLPVPYDGNNQLKFTDEFDTNGQFMIVCQLQMYNLSPDGTPNTRRTYTCAIHRASLGSAPAYNERYEPTRFTSVTVLNSIVQQMATQSMHELKSNPSGEGYISTDTYFEVDNFTLIPMSSTMISNLKFREISWLMIDGLMHIFCDMTDCYNKGYYIDEGKDIEIGSKYIAWDEKTLSFGSLLSQYEVKPNGTGMQIKISMRASNYDFKLLLSMQNKLIDITNDFVVKMPFTSLNGEENTAKKIQRELANINGIFDIVQGVAETGIQIAGAVMTGGMSLVGGSVQSATQNTKINYSRIDRKVTSVNSSKTTERMQQPTAGGLVGSIRQIANGVTDLVYANKPKYSSTQGTFATSDGVINAINGFGCMYIQPDNETFVEELLKRVGRTLFYPVKSYEEIFNNINSEFNYDVVKMQTVVLYGSFSQEVAAELTDIMLQGFRVFNSKDVTI